MSNHIIPIFQTQQNVLVDISTSTSVVSNFSPINVITVTEVADIISIPAPPVPSSVEIISNGNFDNDSYWGLYYPEVTIGNGTMNFDGTASAKSAYGKLEAPMTAGKNYRISLDASAPVSLRIYNPIYGDIFPWVTYPAGHNEVDAIALFDTTAGVDALRLIFYGGATSIDNLSIKEL